LDPIIVPTVGFSTPIRRALFGLNVVFFDLGGGARIRGVWPNYFADVHGVVYVVDAADPARMAESADELHAALMHPMVVGKPVLMCVLRRLRRCGVGCCLAGARLGRASM
jgi:ADP-ribosylation factor-like protein 13B